MKKDPFADDVARSVRKRGDQKHAIFLSIKKARGIICCESRLEATLVSVAALDPRVVAIRPQPATFDLNSGRMFNSRDELKQFFKGAKYKPKIYTPDFCATLVDQRQIFLEAKDAIWIKNNEEYLDYPSILRAFGFRLLLVTEAFLEGPLKQNARLLRDFIGSKRQPDLWRDLPDRQMKRGEFETLYGIGKREAFEGIVSGDLECCLTSSRIGPEKLLRKSAGSTKHLELLPF